MTQDDLIAFLIALIITLGSIYNILSGKSLFETFLMGILAGVTLTALYVYFKKLGGEKKQ